VPGPRRSDCPISFALDLFGDRWTFLVIRDLMFKGKRRYSEFLASEEGMATNILADRLRKLEGAGIVVRTQAARNAGGLTYSLTEKGLDLAPLLVETVLWSAKHDASTAADPAFVTAATLDRPAVLTAVRQQHTDRTN